MMAARAFESLILLAWLAVLYVLVRLAVPRVKNLGRTSDIIAGAAVVIFLLGSAWHPTTRLKGLVAQAPVGAPVLADAVPAPAIHPVSCPVGVSPKPGARGHIDAVAVDGVPVANGSTVTISSTSRVRFGGWAATGSHAATSVCLIVDGKVIATTGSYGIARQDVATAFKVPAMAATGFDASALIPRGSHHVSIASVDGSDVKAIDQTINFVVR